MASGFFVPGLENRYNTKEVREAILKPDKTKVTSEEKKLGQIENEKTAWQLINRRIVTLNTIAKQILSLNSPFNQMMGNSSNQDALTLSTQYGAKKETHKIDIEQIAGADIFLSDNFNQKDTKIPAGDYTFFVGKKEIKIRNNGNLNALVSDINSRGKDFLSAKIIKSDNDGNSRLVLQSLKEGEENKLIMKDKALEFAKDLGMLSELKTNFYPSILEIVENQKSDKNNIALDTENLVLNPLSEVSIDIPEDIKVTEKTKIRFEIKYDDADFSSSTNKIVFAPGEATLQDARVESEESIIDLGPDANGILKEKKYIQMDMVKLFGKTGSISLEPINISNEFDKVEIEIGSIADLEEINIENKANNRRFTIRNIEVYDPRNRDGYLPINAKSFAENAKMKFDGVDVERDSNTIKDLIPNVTLNLKKTSNETIDAKIEPDYDSIKKLLYDFLSAYNEVLSTINITSSKDDTSKSNNEDKEDKKDYRKSNIIEELVYLTKEEKEDAYRILGTLKSEFMLKSIKSQLEGIIFRPYRTDDPNFSIINQIGVYTNSAFSGNGLSRYLQLDENKFNEIIQNNIISVKELFASDFNDDRVYDDGLAKRLGDYLAPLVNFGGPINSKVKSFDDRIFNQRNSIEDYKKKYEDKEKKVESDLNKLDSTLKNMQNQERTLRSLNIDKNKQ